MKKVIKRSVHDIVDLLLRKGHLDTRIFNQASMNEGTRLHSLYQSEQGENYQAEVSLSEQLTAVILSLLSVDKPMEFSKKKMGHILSKRLKLQSMISQILQKITMNGT